MVYDPEKEAIVPHSFKFDGEIRGRNIKGKVKEPALELHRADIHLIASNEEALIRQCELAYNNTDISLSGHINGFDDLLSPHSSTMITGSLEADGLNISELLISSESESTEEGSVPKEVFPYNMLLNINCNNLIFNDLTITSLKGNLRSNKRELGMNQGELVALDGSAISDLRFTTIGENYLLDLNSKITDMDIHQLFKDLNEFDQDEITSENLSGRLSGTLIAKVMFDHAFEVHLDKLYAKADVEVKNGHLINYEPLQELSAFIDVKELENVKFNSLKNTIEIFDETIFIPRMYIGNSALSLELEGTHTFSNQLDYHLSINVIELLAQRSNWFARKRQQRAEDNEHGGLTAHIHMTGTPDDLKITYDKIGFQRVFKDELQREKQEFIQVLKGETPEDETPDSYYNDIRDE